MTFGKYFTVMLATAIKFFNGPIAGILLGLTWWETAICCIIGMMTTVTLITFLGKRIQALIGKYRKSKPKLFSKRTRFAVKIWKKLGIWGIACFTPLFFTPIGGTLLALSFKVPFSKIFFTMLLFAVSWGIIFSYLIFQITWLKSLFV
ncbi:MULTISPECIES: small multi-drug export protein [unclassified Arcicella]|uniref:small multi-drug export protein n=1 Tax=unclassified Arcicella TaxID=2644986 RepID=UPI00285D90A8|nr:MULTISPECIES: small multi-drug export protein [unclassified Arcicella]MDR6560929.1 putative membrane protein [Arcicella sp. BE51]MDR6810813.1 putative membrane protein [Arcicella sp. BE140]MDR6822163.1 putative membrane protein [Arcicella sp. BE139]